MKKYTTLTTDTSALVTEVLAYLNKTYDVEDVEHHTNAFHLIDSASLATTSIDSTFTGLTTKFAGHLSINGSLMNCNNYDLPFILVPLENCESVVVKFFDVADGAVKQPNTPFYSASDCTLNETLPLTSPLLVPANTTYALHTTDAVNLGDVLIMFPNEDVSSYLE
jgi:hypothetical protein